MLHAGLEGIEKGYELPEPMEQNLYHLTPEERAQRGIEQLPETLGEAIEIAAESELVLRILGEHTFNRFIEIKREEWDEYRVQVTPVRDRALPADPLGLSRPPINVVGGQVETRQRLGSLKARVQRGDRLGFEHPLEAPAAGAIELLAGAQRRTGSRISSSLTLISKLPFEGRA